MTTQPEALRLADILQHKLPSIECLEVAADELRRLHDEVQQLKSDLSEEVLLSNAMLEVKDELLAALKEVYTTCDWHGDDGQEAMMKASAAINKAERTTT
jgi:hypothetical protein